METLEEFIFLGSKITVGGDCSHEIKRCLLLGRKAMGAATTEARAPRTHAPQEKPVQSMGSQRVRHD